MPPRFIEDEAGLMSRLEEMYSKGYRHLVCSNLAHIALGRQLGFVLHGDSGCMSPIVPPQMLTVNLGFRI